MITTTPAIDPTLVNLILAGLIDREKPLDALAADVGMDLDELLDLLENPDLQAKIQRLQRVLDQRAALLNAAAEATAIGALSALMEQARTDQAQRDRLLAQRNTEQPDDPEHAQRIDDQLAELDRRFKKLTEAARSARATLSHARTSRRRSSSQYTEPHPNQFATVRK